MNQPHGFYYVGRASVYAATNKMIDICEIYTILANSSPHVIELIILTAL
jgi:hypothetical protein